MSSYRVLGSYGRFQSLNLFFAGSESGRSGENVHVGHGKGFVPLRCIASILGNFTWAVPTIPFAQAHYRSLQKFYIQNLKRWDLDLDSKCFLSEDARSDLNWWVVSLEKLNGKRFSPMPPDLEIFSDASLSGWGAVCNSVTTRGPWTGADSRRHIK